MLGVKKRFDETATEVGDYDKFFLAEVLKREKYGFDSQAARAYFASPSEEDGYAIAAKLGARYVVAGPRGSGQHPPQPGSNPARCARR